jgi:hypothetical protein
MKLANRIINILEIKDDTLLDIKQMKDGLPRVVKLKWRDVAFDFAKENKGKNFPSTSSMGNAIYNMLKKRKDAEFIKEIQEPGNPKLWNKLGSAVLGHLKKNKLMDEQPMGMKSIFIKK